MYFCRPNSREVKKQNVLFEVPAMTPLMEQYNAMKAKHPDAILLYRVGDFYETFGEDALKTSAALGIVLTKRNNGGSDIELAGFPFHSLDAYLPKLVRAGYRVAICEQLEKPSKGKKVVQRGITDVITPGVTTDDKLLDLKKNNFLCSIAFLNENIGISFADISTGEFYIAEGDPPYIHKLIQSFQPSEIILSKSIKEKFESAFGDQYYVYSLEDWIFQFNFGREKLLKHFHVQTLKGFGVEYMNTGQIAAGAILYYLESTENKNPAHLAQISRLASDQYMWMDRFTIRNLELVDVIHPEGTALIHVLDQTKTPMGSRMLRKWILMPLIHPDQICQRLDAVDFIINHSELVEDVNQHLQSFGDLERLVSKIPLRRISPRELLHIRNCLRKISPIRNTIHHTNSELLKKVASGLQDCTDLEQMLATQLQEEAPNTISKGGIFNPEISSELDELRHMMTNGKDMLLDIQREESLKTGIANLKIGFNSVFGYFLEVTNKYKNQNLVPAHWIRKQTMVNGERYITEELKNLEVKILSAEERSFTLEEELYQKLLDNIQEHVNTLQNNAKAIAELDCLISFAQIAIRNHYCKPELDEGLSLDIKDGRHPVIEKQLPLGEEYIPNDIYLDPQDHQILMITGPNMSGKSAILRQTALICLMAQMGSFVPATHARIGVIDRIFTRVGASDNLSSGESTFMVEMNETASILNNLSARSLVLLDEIGRGTSTYDGISIAWAITEFLHEQTDKKPKTLFATHYHELNELEKHFPGIKNYHVTTQEINNKVLFLRKLVQGGSEHSFGIHVAQMAGMPQSIISRAQYILKELEAARSKTEAGSHLPGLSETKFVQVSLIDSNSSQESEIIGQIQKIDVQTMTPIECMMKIAEWKTRLKV